MKYRFLLIFSLLIGALSANASVEVEITGGLESPTLKRTIEQQTMKLLNAINRAESQNDYINYSGIDISTMASGSLGSTWNEVHFRTEEDDIVCNVLSIKNGGRVVGYQIRDIQMEMVPLNDTYDSEMVRELCIDFDLRGRITDASFTMGLHNVTKIMRESKSVEDLERRMQIIAWCEKFQNAYTNKDKQFMRDIFSDDALIITGKVVSSRVKGDIKPKSSVIYTTQGKQEYLRKLFAMFDRPNYYINVKFEDFTVVRHGVNPNIYGVTLKQKWHSSGYSDEGIVFLVWDFTDEEHPVIHVRTWQPMSEKPFELGDFNVGTTARLR